MNEELGIDAFALLGRVLLCSTLPRAVPTTDGVWPFRVWWVRSGESVKVYCSNCWRIVNNYTRGGRICNQYISTIVSSGNVFSPTTVFFDTFTFFRLEQPLKAFLPILSIFSGKYISVSPIQ